MEPQSIDNYFTTRRTVRAYDPDRQVDPNLIRRLVSVAAQAANTGNMQIYCAVMTTDPDEIKALAPAHFSQPAIMNAKSVLTFCIDFRRYHRWCQLGGGEPGLNNLQGYTWGVLDTAIFAQQFVTLAELEGLGTCYLGTTTYNAPMIADTLKLPNGVVPIITVTVGYPAENPLVSERLPLNAILHDGVYHDPTDEDLKDFYSEKESMESYRRFVEENGKENLAQLYAQVRYPRASNEHFSAVLKKFIKAQGIDI